MKGSKKTSKNSLIILLIVLLLALAVGYAAFSDTLNITGTANVASANFDLEFTSATVDSCVGCDRNATIARITNLKNTLEVTVKDLAYPGAGAQFTAVIKNVGDLPAKIESVAPTGIQGEDDIKITGLDAISTAHPVIKPNETCTITFAVEWDPNANAASATTKMENGITFNLGITYTQDTDTALDVLNKSTNHVDSTPTT